jgi:hypothetical protein
MGNIERLCYDPFLGGNAIYKCLSLTTARPHQAKSHLAWNRAQVSFDTVCTLTTSPVRILTARHGPPRWSSMVPENCLPKDICLWAEKTAPP